MNNKVSIDQINEAYIKLKSHIYYDSTELFQRINLAEFEALKQNPTLIPIKHEVKDIEDNVNEKLNELWNELNSDINSEYFEKLLGKIKLKYLPKKFKHEERDENFLSNQRVKKSYEIEKVTIFADFPIELHLVCVLWLMNFGYKLDAKLDDSCIGNRLILTKDKSKLVGGSGLFKPYYKQYQKWRDEAVKEAQKKLEYGSNVAFINLDLKDYFYSIKLDFKEIEKELPEYFTNTSPVHVLFKKIHFKYNELLKKEKYPSDSYDLKKISPPIGIVSSYILANYYLHKFDKRVHNVVPKAYFSRYVDDIILVIENPDFEFHEKEENLEIGFKFSRYYQDNKKTKKISFAKNDTEYRSNVPQSERFILETLYPLVKLVDEKSAIKTEEIEKSPIKRVFEINGIDGAIFQGDKTFIYYFDTTESTTVMDKLKQELEARASEFRDFPDGDDFGNESFDEQAYHLVFDGTEGKIRTLKDYKENRYGLSVFLANRIFSALGRAKTSNKKESDKVLKLFRGINNLEHYRLWEKVFTFFLVNDDKASFLNFYIHSIRQIITLYNNAINIGHSGIKSQEIAKDLLIYLKIAKDMALSLNTSFMNESNKLSAEDKELIQVVKECDQIGLSNLIDTLLYDPKQMNMFRNSNLVRHQYVSYPLANYMDYKSSKETSYVNRLTTGLIE